MNFRVTLRYQVPFLISAKCFAQGGEEAGERERNYILSYLINGAGRILRVDSCFRCKEIVIFMGSEGLLPCSKDPTTRPCPETDESIQHHVFTYLIISPHLCKPSERR